MFHYILITLFDLTATGVLSHNAHVNNIKPRNQQRNWQVVSQLIQMRAQPIMIAGPVDIKTDVTKLDFGLRYRGKQKVWIAHWAVEQTDLYGTTQDPFEVLKLDFDQIPLLDDLDETVKIDSPVLITQGEHANICFYNAATWPQEVFAIDFDTEKNI